MWDLATKECLHTVKPKVSDCGTVSRRPTWELAYIELSGRNKKQQIMVIFAKCHVDDKREREAVGRDAVSFFVSNCVCYYMCFDRFVELLFLCIRRGEITG